MSDERCSPYKENLAAYALGVLDVEEIPILESHLENCMDCQADLADFRSVTKSLLQAVPPKTPPLELRGKLVARLPSHRTRTPNFFTAVFGQFSLGQVITIATVVLLLGSNLFSSMQIRSLQRQQSELSERLSTEQAAIAMLAYPDTEALEVNADIQNLTGSMLVDRDLDTAVLVLWGLPQVEMGNTYQIWLIDADGNRISGGLFIPTDEQDYTTATIESPLPIGQFVGLGVTIEPGGGSEGPTGPRVLSIDL